MLTLNRSTLAPKSIKCFGPNDNAPLNTYLKTLKKDDLVFASTTQESPLGNLNLAPIGGTDFTAAGAPSAYAYSIIGYGATPAGLAVESYKTSPLEAWDGIEGSLINMGSTTPIYGFRSTDSPAFAVQPAPAGGTAKITIGYVTSFPIGEGAPPRYFNLPSGFTNVTYTSPACSVTCAGGFFTAVFDAYSLKFLWSNTYATNSDSSQAEMARMVADLNYHLRTIGPPRFVIITSVGDPFGSANNWFDVSVSHSPSQELVDTIQSLNVSGSAVNLLITGGSFSMIGVPGALPAPNQGNHNITKWYSSSLQAGETGALRGLLQRDNAYRYRPQSVAAFTVDSSVPTPTANQLLSFAIPDQLGVAPSVEWPVMDTAARRNAYAYASDRMNRDDFYGGEACRLPVVQCQDIRARYTSSQLTSITTGIDPRDIPYPSRGDAGFEPRDLTDVTTQLNFEKQYLKNSATYASVLKEINTNALQNIGLSVQNAATNVASSVTQAKAPTTQIDLRSSILSIAGSALSIVGAVVTPVGVISGVLATATSVVGVVNAAKAEPDPQVKNLANLLAETNGAASQYAYRFNTAVQSSTGMYFNDAIPTGSNCRPWDSSLSLPAAGGITRPSEMHLLNSTTTSSLKPVSASSSRLCRSTLSNTYAQDASLLPNHL